MIKINWLRIVPCFMLFFILFLSPISANEIEKIKSETVSGGYFIGRLHEPGTLKFKNEIVPVDDFGYFQLGFSREMAGLHELEIIPTQGPSTYYPILIELREFNEQRITGVDQATVTPPKSVQARIEKEYFQVKAAREGLSELTAWRDETFIWPIFSRITGVYGSRRFYNGTPGTPHWGVDMAAKQGSPIYAPASGQVLLAADLYFSGGTIIVDHGHGLNSSFLHLSEFNVEEGQFIQQGDIIGFVGSTGRSTGPHLDWRMNLVDERIDAQLWVPNMDSLCVFQATDCETPTNLNTQQMLSWLHNRKALLTRALTKH